MTTILCPGRLDEVTAAKFLLECRKCISEQEVILHFGSLSFAFPAGVLVLAIGIKDFHSERKKLGLKTSVLGIKDPTEPVSYLAFFGFFEFINVRFGNGINRPQGKPTYFPITGIKRSDLEVGTRVIQEEIEDYAARLAKVMYSSKEDLACADMLAYCLREIIRNVFEHAEVDECYVMGQRWNNGEAEIAIVDRGIGLVGSLSKGHKVVSEREAISLAILPGITRITEPVNDDRWQNSGFGLYIISEVGREFGSFSIATNEEMLVIDKGVDGWAEVPMKGTMVKLRASTEDSEYFGNILQNIVEKGEAEAARIQGARSAASKGSKLTKKELW